VCLNPSSKVVLPWNILSVGGSGKILQQFFDEIIATKIEPTVQLESASLGKSKNSLDLSLPLDSTVELFGPFLRYYVKDNNLRKSSPRLRNTFEILMSSQCLPTIIHQVRTLFRLLWIVCGILFHWILNNYCTLYY